MKINIKHLSLFYIVSFCFYTLYTVLSIEECEAYWMHDASITISKNKIRTDIYYLFLLPIFVILVQKVFQIKIQIELFVTHFLAAFLSISLLMLAINQPCEHINNGHYMFIDTFMTIGYYLLKLSSFVLMGIIIIWAIILKIKTI